MANFILGSSAFATWHEEVQSGIAPVYYNVGDGRWSSIEIGPGNITLLGGGPGAGKSALSTQLTYEAVLNKPNLRAMIASVEMSPRVIFDRQLARLSRISATYIRKRTIDADTPSVREGMQRLEEAGERIAFLEAPFDMNNLAGAAEDFEAELLVVDYIQRFKPSGEQRGLREDMGEMMSNLRQMAELGAAVLVVSAVTRGRGENGATYDRAALGLASFRESSELEYGADSAWMLSGGGSSVQFDCLKNRHGETPQLTLTFDRACQSFEIQPELVNLDKLREAATACRSERRPTRGELKGKLVGNWAKVHESANPPDGEVDF